MKSGLHADLSQKGRIFAAWRNASIVYARKKAAGRLVVAASKLRSFAAFCDRTGVKKREKERV